MPASPLLVADVCRSLELTAPSALAESWDNVGLLLGDRAAPASRVMTCLTATPESVAEAIAEKASLIVAHHPFPFDAVRKITTDDVSGKMLWDLTRAGISLYSPHTAFDSAATGINQRIAVGLGLADLTVIRPIDAAASASVGAGRIGTYATPLPIADWLDRVARFFSVDGLHFVDGGKPFVGKVAVACGAAGSFLPDVAKAGCDAFVTGELRFHAALEARASQIHVAVPGHHATERFAVEGLADELTERFPQLQIWASRSERDPLAWHSVPARASR